MLPAVPSGMSQGSLIGTLLFIVYINDPTNQVDSCEMSLYADAYKLFREATLVTICQVV